jgi:hypothetical protein
MEVGPRLTAGIGVPSGSFIEEIVKSSFDIVLEVVQKCCEVEE